MSLTVTPSMPGVLLPLFAATARQANRKLRLSVFNCTDRGTALRGLPDSTDRVFSARSVTRHYRALHLCPQISPASKTYRSPVPLRLRGRLSRPQATTGTPPRTSPSPVSTDSLLSANRQTRTVPMFPFSTLGWLGGCFTPGSSGGTGKKE